MSTRNTAEILTGENQSKFIQHRVALTEKHFGDMCDLFGALLRKQAKTRDKRDELCKTLWDYGESDSVKMNSSTKESLKEFSQNLSTIELYRDALIKKLETHVVAPLSTYGEVCKHTKEDLKSAFAARDKEVKQKKAVDKVKDKHPSDRKQISQAETELQRATVDASRTEKALEEQMDSFEQKRIQDVKKVLSNFVMIEMSFHAKALECYTKCYESLNGLNEDEDLEEFRNSMRPASSVSRLDKVRAMTSSQTSLNSQAQKSTPHHKSDANKHKSSNLGNTMYDDDDEDDDDDDDYDEDDDDDDDESYDDDIDTNVKR